MTMHRSNGTLDSRRWQQSKAERDDLPRHWPARLAFADVVIDDKRDTVRRPSSGQNTPAQPGTEPLCPYLLRGGGVDLIVYLSVQGIQRAADRGHDGDNREADEACEQRVLDQVLTSFLTNEPIEQSLHLILIP